MEYSIGKFLELNANRYPERTALLYRGRRFTYRDLNFRVNRLAHHLLDLGARKGDRVGYIFHNSNQFVEIYYASQKIGAIAVPVNFRSVPREIKWMLDNARCKVFVYGQACARQVEPIKRELATVKHLVCSGPGCPPGEHSFESFTQEGNDREPGIRVTTEDPAIILYTGGTTGFPKGVLHTQGSLLFWCISGGLIKAHFSDPSEVQVNQLPLFHNAGLNVLNASVAVGGKHIIVETFDPEEIMGLIHEEKATYIFLLPPASYIRLMDLPNFKEYDTCSITRVGCAAGNLSKSLMLRIFDAFPNASIFYGYGLTEGGSGIFGYITRSMVEEDSEKIGSIGQEMPFAEVRLVDEEGREVATGEVGEATFRGPATMKEYYGQPELTAKTIRDGWVYTGDLLRKDEDGYFYFVDRKKDMIKTGGENVFANEVEGVIMTHPAVELCAVIGIPDPELQEAVMAIIKLRDGHRAAQEEIIDHCKRYLASYKKPRRVAFVDSFPMGGGSKVQKFILKKQYSSPAGE